jgi:hypothetical protein
VICRGREEANPNTMLRAHALDARWALALRRSSCGCMVEHATHAFATAGDQAQEACLAIH